MNATKSNAKDTAKKAGKNTAKKDKGEKLTKEELGKVSGGVRGYDIEQNYSNKQWDSYRRGGGFGE